MKRTSPIFSARLLGAFQLLFRLPGSHEQIIATLPRTPYHHIAKRGIRIVLLKQHSRQVSFQKMYTCFQR